MNLADEDKIEEEFDDSIQGKYDHNKKFITQKHISTHHLYRRKPKST